MEGWRFTLFCISVSYYHLFIIILCITVLLGIRKAYAYKDVRSDAFIYISYLAIFFYIASMLVYEDAIIQGLATGNTTTFDPVGSLKLIKWAVVVIPMYIPYILNINWFFYFFLHSAWLRLFKPPHSSNLAFAIMVFPAHFIVMNFLLQCTLCTTIDLLMFSRNCSTGVQFFANWLNYVMYRPLYFSSIVYLPCGFVILWNWLHTGRMDRYLRQFIGSCFVSGVLVITGNVFQYYALGQHIFVPLHLGTVLWVDESVRYYSYRIFVEFFHPTIPKATRPSVSV